MQFKDAFPPIEISIELDPEDLAPFVLRYLSNQKNINRYNFTLGSSPELVEYAGENRKEFCRALMEAWMWLERELFIVPQPGEQGEWMYITKRGEKVLQEENFEFYKRGERLNWDKLDPVLVRKLKADYLKGDFDIVIFKAFKEVEIRVRKKAQLTVSDYGVELMKKAFGPGSGLLTNKGADKGEQVAVMNFFSGAIGMLKNPTSHRDVGYSDSREVEDMLAIANHLLRMIDKIIIDDKERNEEI